MAHITWMNTPIPDVGNTQQQGIRTAADLLGNATRSATAGVAGLQAIQDAEKAAQVQAADRFVLENMLSTNDPAKYEQMRADGSLLGPAASKASSAALIAAEQRGNQLYDQAKVRTRDQELRAAEAIWDKAAPIAVSDPAEAQRILGTAKFSNAEDSAKFSHDARQLFVTPDKTGNEHLRKEGLQREANILVEQVLSKGTMNPQGAAEALGKHPDPLVRGMAVDRLNELKYPTAGIYGPAPATNPLDSIVSDTGSLRGGVIEGTEGAMFKHTGNNLSIGMRAAGAANPPPGSEAWNAANGGRTPSQADISDWGNTYVLPGSEKERGKGKGSTAIGPYQIVNKTRLDVINRFGKQLFGTSDPKQIPYTPENEDKIGAVIYRESAKQGKPGAPWEATKDYAGLKDLSAFKGVSWDEAKPLIQHIESGVVPPSFSSRVKQFEAELRDRELALTEGQKVILNAEGKKDYGLNEATSEVAKSLGKDADLGEVREVLETTVRKAKEAGTVITHAEAAGLLLNRISTDNWRTISDFTKDLDLEESKLMDSAKDLGNARADLKSFKKNMDTLKRAQELMDQYKKNAAEAQGQLTAAKNKADAGYSAISAFRKWQDTSDQIRKLVAPKATTEVNTNLVNDVRTASESPAPQTPTQRPAQGPVQATRPPDIDLMLAPPSKDPVPTLTGTKPPDTDITEISDKLGKLFGVKPKPKSYLWKTR